MDIVIKAVDVEGRVVGQVDIWHEGTSTGDLSIYPVDGVRMEVFSWEDGGDYKRIGEEGGRSLPIQNQEEMRDGYECVECL